LCFWISQIPALTP